MVFGQASNRWMGCNIGKMVDALLASQKEDKLEIEIQEIRKMKREVERYQPSNKIIPYDKLVHCPHCPGAYANEMMKFVGFRGKTKYFKHPKDRYP